MFCITAPPAVAPLAAMVWSTLRPIGQALVGMPNQHPYFAILMIHVVGSSRPEGYMKGPMCMYMYMYMYMYICVCVFVCIQISAAFIWPASLFSGPQAAGHAQLRCVYKWRVNNGCHVKLKTHRHWPRTPIADIDTDTDINAEADSDTDTDADADAYAHAEIDIDTDTDTDAEAATASDADIDNCSGAMMG